MTLEELQARMGERIASIDHIPKIVFEEWASSGKTRDRAQELAVYHANENRYFHAFIADTIDCMLEEQEEA